MSTFQFPLAARLGGIGQSSSRKFQLRLLEHQRQEANRQIAAITDMMEAELEEQKKLVELQQIGMDGLAEAIRLNTEAVEAADEFAHAQADQATDRLAALDEALNDRSKRVSELETKVELLIKWLQQQATETAGGKIGAAIDEKRDALGIVYATGDIRLWRSSHGNIPGGSGSKAWLRCDGQRVNIAEFPELFDVIGHDWDAAPMDGRFRIPAKTDLTSDQRILDDDKWVYLMRT